MQIHKHLISPILDHLDSETWHVNAVNSLHIAQSNPITLKSLEFIAGKRITDKRLEVQLANIKLENPLLVGAGWDKNGLAVKSLYTLGFAGVEVGSVLTNPQEGNPKPRQFMIGPGVALNRLGFNSKGVEEVAKNLLEYEGSGIPIGVNIGKNKDIVDNDAPMAYAEVAKKLFKYASYFVINVSSPNTPGLRRLQEKKFLAEIVEETLNVQKKLGKVKPTFVKIAPDLELEKVDDIIELVLDKKLAGIVATNTTIREDLKAKYGKRWTKEAGGLSGDDEEFRLMSTQKIAYIYKKTKGKINIIGIGGVKDAETALEKIQAGATAVQLVTAIRGEGLSAANSINRGLLNWVERQGLKNISEVVGSDYKSFLADK